MSFIPPHAPRTLIAGALALLLTGCGEDPVPTPEPARPTFTQDVVPLLQGSCGFGSGCHGTAYPAGYVPLSPSVAEPAVLLARLKEASVREPSLPRVRPGDPAGSFLLHKVTGDYTGLPCALDACGERMPQRSAPLPAADVAMLERWIEQGAVLE
ncbi:hypothetical protein [Archangium primigenium]|uniref:hypothetical protein n=1 Tax=[Archangium] primigenium TaxID=2792470 RepID=UPI00195C5405|nr:hypothetical protein [Archangium primigenium]MBM7116081.1 hypothetical protein [Archangium primigenium]